MFNKFALVFAGLMLSISSLGCCCHGYGAGYAPWGGANRCAPCNQCAPQGGGYYQPQQGAFYQGYDASQTAFAPGATSQTAYVPGYAPTQSAYMPSQTATLPPIIGQPIYNTAVVPTNMLNPY